MLSEQALLDAIDGYKDTVLFLLALIHELTWDDVNKKPRADVVHEHGVQQRRNSNDVVTPDVALRFVGECGILGDAKVSFAKGTRERAKIRDQLLKYDQAIGLWRADQDPKRHVPAGGTILLTHHTREVDAQDYFNDEIAAGRFTVSAPFAIVGCVRNNQREEYVTLRRSLGTVPILAKDEKLRRGVSIKVEHLNANFRGIRFYDASPPMPYLLSTIWDIILSAHVPEDCYQVESRTDAVKTTPVSVETIAMELRDFLSLRSVDKRLPGAPRNELVAQALERLVALGLGAKVTDHRYEFRYRKLRGGSLAYFVKRLAKSSNSKGGKTRARKGAQLELFDQPKPLEIARKSAKEHDIIL